jgi:hypothetical protein
MTAPPGGALAPVTIMTSARAGFVPVQVMANPDMLPTASSRPAPSPAGLIEIDMPNGVRVRVGHGADLKIVRSVLAALDWRDAAGR